MEGGPVHEVVVFKAAADDEQIISVAGISCVDWHALSKKTRVWMIIKTNNVCMGLEEARILRDWSVEYESGRADADEEEDTAMEEEGSDSEVCTPLANASHIRALWATSKMHVDAIAKDKAMLGRSMTPEEVDNLDALYEAHWRVSPLAEEHLPASR